MSASDEGSVWGAALKPEGAAPADGAPGRPRFPWSVAVGRDRGAPRSSEGEGAFPDAEAFESEWDRMETGGRVLRGREGRPGSPADAEGPTLGYLADEATTALLQQLTDREALRVRRHPSPESLATRVSSLWVDVEAGAAGRGVPAPSWAGAQLAAAAPLHPWPPRGGRAWGYAKRSAMGRSARTVRRPRAPGAGPIRRPSDSSDSSDEVAEMQLMRVRICRREAGRARGSSPEDPGDAGRQPCLPQAPGPSAASAAARGLGSRAERQAAGELDASPEKVPSAVWGKAGGRPSYAGAAGFPPRVAARRKAAQEKKPAGGATRVAVGRSLPSWGQRASAAPPEPATFPPIAGVRLLSRDQKHLPAPPPWRPRQFKPSGAGRRPAACRARESEPVAAEAEDPRREPAAQGQEPGSSCQCLQHGGRGEPGEGSGGDFSATAPQSPGRDRPRAVSQVDCLPRGPAPSSDQEPVGHPQSLEREQQPPPGAPGCPRCLELQREVDDLKEQLAAMQSLVGKLEGL